MIAVKTPAERQAFVYDFGADLGSATIQSVQAGTPISTPRGAGVNLAVYGAATILDHTVIVQWQGGAEGEDYLTVVRILDSDGQIHEQRGEILVRASDFSLPEGVASRYLSGEEYVARFGAAETIRLTDENGTRSVDAAKLEEAIKDQTDIVDAYVGGRFTVPLSTVPRVIKTIVAVLTREALHKTKPTPEVTAAADRARVQLRDISTGRMGLPIEEGGSVPVIGSNRSSLTSGDGAGSSFKDQLDGYSLTPASYVPEWRRN